MVLPNLFPDTILLISCPVDQAFNSTMEVAVLTPQFLHDLNEHWYNVAVPMLFQPSLSRYAPILNQIALIPDRSDQPEV